MDNRTHIHIALGLLVVLTVLGAIMRSQVPPRIDLPFETTSTTLAAEFASTPEELNAVIGSDRKFAKPLQNQQYLDFPFIAGYVALFIIVALSLRNYDLPGAKWLAWIAIGCAVLAGLFDIGENISILKAATTPATFKSNVRYFSVPKWGLVFLLMAIESTVFLFWPRLKLWWRLAAVVVGGLFLFVGASGVLFSSLVSITDIVWSAEWIPWALTAMTVFLIAIEVRQVKQLRY